MKIGKGPNAEWVSVQTVNGTYQFHEHDGKLDIKIHDLQPEFDTCVEADRDDVSSGTVFTDTFTHSRFYLVLYVENKKFVLVSLDGSMNAYGTSAPMICGWNAVKDNSLFCTKEELAQIIKAHKLERADMRCSAVPGQAGWYKCHIKDCHGLPDHVTFDGEIVKSKEEAP